MTHLQTATVKTCDDLFSQENDAVVLVAHDPLDLPVTFKPLLPSIKAYNEIVTKFNTGVHVLVCDQLPSKRLVVSLTGPLDRDYDDVRRFTEASKEGILHAVKIGSNTPALALALPKTTTKLDSKWAKPDALCLATLLSALEALYVPLEVREFSGQPRPEPLKPLKSTKVDYLSWMVQNDCSVNHDQLVHLAWCIEEGRRVARDIGGSDPERMCANNIISFLKKELSGGAVLMRVEPVDEKLYPLAAVVDRGSNSRHRGSIVHLEYPSTEDQGGSSEQLRNLFLVGKGIVYDTGGSDLKVGGIMATMHRDKCGAAAVAGFFKVLSLLRPDDIKVHGSLALVRNSIGENAYVSDEIITSRAGVRVRVTNTDAEGRMVMTDLLCEAKEKALSVSQPHLMTFATLTGHVILSYGPNYTALVCNGPARRNNEDEELRVAGSLLGEMHEISTLRREDFEAHTSKDDYADVNNSAHPVGGKRCRGHQSPAAFMITASGLDAHMCNGQKPLPYTHFDIAGSQGQCPGIPSGVPILTLCSRYLLNKFWK